MRNYTNRVSGNANATAKPQLSADSHHHTYTQSHTHNHLNSIRQTQRARTARKVSIEWRIWNSMLVGIHINYANLPLFWAHALAIPESSASNLLNCFRVCVDNVLFVCFVVVQSFRMYTRMTLLCMLLYVYIYTLDSVCAENPMNAPCRYGSKLCSAGVQM